MSSPCSLRPQRRRQHAPLSGRTDSSAESDEETKVANERRRKLCYYGITEFEYLDPKSKLYIVLQC